ncbi:ATP-binding protein [Streptomyces sp. JJ66]|uniref:ATP-binding protein n=1 Tax=Streptomyces sp. JJ66 TaxID=2803843 RepID=UPI001C58FBC1|nr:ATP-binding protein [Streptomyces sp. JJ66]MBW1602794.1 ATP-binding protein [Streptomyces sp. JJ66]
MTVTPLTQSPDQWSFGLQLTNNHRAPGIARRTLHAAMGTYGVEHDVTHTALLLASELVTNGVKHSDGPVYIRASVRRKELRVSVWDNDSELPDPLTVTTDDCFGRGLFIVEQLARNWGRYALGSSAWGGDDHGKVVWFVLDV